jgi:hypothetical protein
MIKTLFCLVALVKMTALVKCGLKLPTFGIFLCDAER